MSTIDYMNECTVRDLVLMLMDERGMSLHDALDIDNIHDHKEPELDCKCQ